MHNCKSTTDSFVELALDEVSPARSAQMLAELKVCRKCREEFATIKSTLRTSGQALDSALPAEEFWAGYHTRLQTALANSLARQDENSLYSPHSQPSSGSPLWLALGSFLTTSVRVPVPLAAALVLLFGVSAFFAMQSLRATTPKSLAVTSVNPASAQTRVVEVPVIKEKVVTRVVYVETNRGTRNAANDSKGLNDVRGEGAEGDAADDDRAPVVNVTNGIARVHPDPRSAAMSLAGFKPTDEVKLTIIKGSDPK